MSRLKWKFRGAAFVMMAVSPETTFLPLPADYAFSPELFIVSGSVLPLNPFDWTVRLNVETVVPEPASDWSLNNDVNARQRS